MVIYDWDMCFNVHFKQICKTAFLNSKIRKMLCQNNAEKLVWTSIPGGGLAKAATSKSLVDLLQPSVLWIFQASLSTLGSSTLLSFFLFGARRDCIEVD